MLPEDKKHIQIGLLFLLLIFLSSVLYFGTELRDSLDYKEVTKYIQGKPANLTSPFAMRPVVPAIIALLEPLVGFGYAYGILSIIMGWISAFVLYLFCKKFGMNEKTAVVSGVLFAVSLPVMVWGFRILTDMSGFCVTICGVWIIEEILYLKNTKEILGGGILLAIALLVRESLGILLVYWILRRSIALLLSGTTSKSFWTRIGTEVIKFCVIIVVMFTPYLIWNRVTAINVAAPWFTYFNTDIFSLQGLWVFAFRSGIAFHILVIFFILGLREKFGKDEKEFYVSFGIAAFILLVFTMITTHIYSPRYAFVLFPIIIPLSAKGIVKFSEFGKKDRTRIGIIVILIMCVALFSVIGALSYPSTFVGNQGSRLGGDLRFALQSWMRRFS
jgi:hypothetical protein